MHHSEIQVGVTYLCRGGWLRRPTKIRPDRFVSYLSWRPTKREAAPSKSVGHIDWFSNAAVSVDAGAVPNGDRGSAA